MHKKISSVQFYLEEAWVSPLKKVSISDKYEYWNIQIEQPSNIICICAISGVGIYFFR